MSFGEIIHESDSPLRHFYFPTTAIASLLYVMEEGASTEITGVGNEGVIGIAEFMGGMTMPDRAIVLSGGHAYRMSSQVLSDELNRPGGRREHMCVALFIVALHSGVDDADSADCHLQSASFDGEAIMSLAAVMPGQVILE